MRTNEERLEDLFLLGEPFPYKRQKEIPILTLYMDQVTSFMDSHLKNTRQRPGQDLYKTTINNYAKNNLLPPPVKKKYTKNHMLLLVFIYYFKNFLPSVRLRTFPPHHRKTFFRFFLRFIPGRYL